LQYQSTLLIDIIRILSKLHWTWYTFRSDVHLTYIILITLICHLPFVATYMSLVDDECLKCSRYWKTCKHKAKSGYNCVILRYNRTIIQINDDKPLVQHILKQHIQRGYSQIFNLQYNFRISEFWTTFTISQFNSFKTRRTIRWWFHLLKN
jgi:hypothetical protein